MIETTIIPYCHYWKGEELMPLSVTDENEQRLWYAEKMICETMPQLVRKDNPRQSLDNAVAAYVSKWGPYQLEETLRVYFKNDATYEEDILRIYLS